MTHAHTATRAARTRADKDHAMAHVAQYWGITATAYADAGMSLDDAPLGAHAWSARRAGLSWEDTATALGTTVHRARRAHGEACAYMRGVSTTAARRSVGLAPLGEAPAPRRVAVGGAPLPPPGWVSSAQSRLTATVTTDRTTDTATPVDRPPTPRRTTPAPTPARDRGAPNRHATDDTRKVAS